MKRKIDNEYYLRFQVVESYFQIYIYKLNTIIIEKEVEKKKSIIFHYTKYIIRVHLE